MTTQHNHRLGLGLLGAPEVRKMVELAQLAETHGFESVWVAETRLTRDGITPCAAIAMATTRLKIATGIVNVYTRGAVLTAVSFVSLDEVSQGRIIMGLGTGSPLVLKPLGGPRLHNRQRPVTPLYRDVSCPFSQYCAGDPPARCGDSPGPGGLSPRGAGSRCSLH